jgi:hypothetical protein
MSIIEFHATFELSRIHGFQLVSFGESAGRFKTKRRFKLHEHDRVGTDDTQLAIADRR